MEKMKLTKRTMDELRDLLDGEAERINSLDFIGEDPVQFPRQFSRLQDIEVVALLSAAIAWGNRKMICTDCRKMMELMDYEPYHYVMESEYLRLPDMNIHRTFFTKDFKYMLGGLRRIFAEFGSLNDFASAKDVAACETPSWQLVALMQEEFSAANGGATNSRCLPTNLATTALKRINMALRWLVRDDGIVDLGVWNAIKPSQLFIPLDVHVGETARALGITSRRSNDRRTVMEITDLLRQMRPHDPVYYDFALFGIGLDDKILKNKKIGQ